MVSVEKGRRRGGGEGKQTENLKAVELPVILLMNDLDRFGGILMS